MGVYISLFFAGLFLGNSLPHLISGVQGRAFQTPFAKPSGVGLSSSTVNVLWGFFNFVIGFTLIARVSDFDFHSVAQDACVTVGALAISIFAARHFGQFHGGRKPR